MQSSKCSSVTRALDLEITFFIKLIVLGGVTVSVLAIGPNVCGFKPGGGLWIFKGDIRRTPSF
jgi:hypothetical protein